MVPHLHPAALGTPGVRIARDRADGRDRRPPGALQAGVPVNGRGRGTYRQFGVLLILVVAHFVMMGWLGDEGSLVRGAPDLLLLALMVYSIRTTPGRASVAGFLVGLLSDALKPVAF